MQGPHRSPFVEGGSSGGRLERLLSIARGVAAEYAANPKVAAIIVAGSVSRGIVDHVSDIDTSVYLHEPFTKEEFEAEKERAIASGGALFGGDEKDGFALWRCVDGVKYDIGFGTLEQSEEIFTDVLEKHSLDGDSHLISDGILKSIPLHGEGIVAGWKKRLAEFPVGLARKMVETHVRVSPFWVASEMCAARNERIWFPELALDYVRHILWVLCGLNRRYYPGKVKGFALTALELPISPRNFLHRTEHLFRLHPNDAVIILKELVEEVHDLVEEHMPEVDVAKAREWFGRLRACG